MKKNFLYYAMAAFVAVSLAACGSDSDDSPAGGDGQPSYPTPAYASSAASFTISEDQAPAAQGGSKLTGINITESGKVIFEVSTENKKQYAAYNISKIDGGTYTIQGVGTIKSSTTRATQGTKLGISVTITIDNQTYTFQTEEDVQAVIAYEQMTGGSNLDKIARTWKVKSMKLTLSGDIKSLSLPVQGGDLGQFVKEVKERDTGFTDEELEELNRVVKSLTIDKTGMLMLEYSKGTPDVATWKWADSSYSNIAIQLKDSEMGNKFIQDNSAIDLKFTSNTCIFTLTTNLEGGSKNKYVATLNINMEP
jgi:hypothetical protein